MYIYALRIHAGRIQYYMINDFTDKETDKIFDQHNC